MNKSLTLFLSVLVLGQPLAVRARTHRYQLSDGCVVTMDVQATRTVLTLAGQPFAIYQVECTQQFNGWTTLTNCSLSASGNFTYVDNNPPPMCFFRVLSAETFVSVGVEDGRITDTPGNPNQGASVNASDTSTSALRAGDVGGSEKLHKAFVSFDTSSIPDGATIVSATLRLRRGTVSGTNPFLTHGTCWMDIKGGTGFSGNTALLATDFEAAADATQVGALSNAVNDGDWSSGSINVTGRQFINKTGKTQLRVYFALHDNGDGKADYIGWYSGENATPANRPVLEVLYR
ncbi:MAG TPA: DNRLRE domain-containing protein [Verrucomicrobiae bacterium]|nr:DNRLRE domain-containing protein [Verrucomicrobiae bacterium]